MTISMEMANLFGLATLLPVAGLAAWYGAWWGPGRLLDVLILDEFRSALAALGLFIAGTVAHELLHALAWALFGRLPLRRIRFGIHWKTLSPYAHCPEPLDVGVYRLGGLAPGAILGLLPSGVGLLTGHAGWMLFGLVFTLAAGGDFASLWAIRKVRPGSRVEDHPTRVGCLVIEPEDQEQRKGV